MCGRSFWLGTRVLLYMETGLGTEVVSYIWRVCIGRAHYVRNVNILFYISHDEYMV